MAFQIEGALETTKIDPASDYFKIAIIGAPGEGKSWLAASCATEEEPAFVFDFDGRRQSILGKPNVTVKSYNLDVDYPNRAPRAWETALKDLQEMELVKERNELPWKWFIPDSMTYLSEAVLHYIMYTDRNMRRTITAAGRDTYVPYGFDTYKAELAEVNGFLQRLMCLGNVICTFHIDYEKDKAASTKTETKYTGRKSVTPPRYEDLLALFNDQWRIKALGPQSYEVQTDPDYEFVAKKTLLIDTAEQPNIRGMLQKHMTNRASQQQ